MFSWLGLARCIGFALWVGEHVWLTDFAVLVLGLLLARCLPPFENIHEDRQIAGLIVRPADVFTTLLWSARPAHGGAPSHIRLGLILITPFDGGSIVTSAMATTGRYLFVVALASSIRGNAAKISPRRRREQRRGETQRQQVLR